MMKGGIGNMMKQVQLMQQNMQKAQEQLAERSGLSQQYLSDLERGKRNPTVVTLLELARALGVSHLDLVVPDAEFVVSPSPSR